MTRVERLLAEATRTGEYRDVLEVIHDFLLRPRGRTVLGFMVPDGPSVLVAAMVRGEWVDPAGARYVTAVDSERPSEMILGVPAADVQT